MKETEKSNFTSRIVGLPLKGQKQEPEPAHPNRIAQLVRECFGEMPSRTTILARFYLLGALTVLCAAILLLTAAYSWIALWAIK